MTRSDRHAPSRIVPTEYEFVIAFWMPRGIFLASTPDLNLFRAREIYNAGPRADIHPSLFNCDVCGSSYDMGELWRHRPTGELITLGHQCAMKYGLVFDAREFHRQRYELLRQAQLAGKAVLRRRETWAKIRECLSANPGLGKLLKQNLRIVKDIRGRFITYGNVSPAQIALLSKLKAQETEKETTLVEVPTGRQTVEGIVLSTKDVEGYYGAVFKMLVEVTTDEGTFRVFGTVPDSLLGNEVLRGTRVRFSAKLEPKERGFGFFSRPTKAERLEGSVA